MTEAGNRDKRGLRGGHGGVVSRGCESGRSLTPGGLGPISRAWLSGMRRAAEDACPGRVFMFAAIARAIFGNANDRSL